MEPVLYFYTTDGTTTCGPVAEDALRQLYKDKMIGPGSFICPQGETEWQPVDVGWLRRAPLQAPRLPAYEPPPYVPTDKAIEREEALAQQIEEKWDEGPIPGVLRWGCIAFAALATLIFAAMQESLQNMVVGLLAGVTLIGLLPYFIALPVKQAWRLRAWAIAVVILSTLTFAGQLSYNKWRGTEAAITAPVNAAPSATITPTEPPQPPVPVDDTPRMVKALQPVQQEMIDKVKASDAAEKACGNFDPATLTSQAALATLRDGINHLHVAQADVLAYFQTYDDRCRTALANGGFSADGIERFVAQVHQSANIDKAVAIWQVRIKLTDDHLARLEFLDKHWGSWQPKDGQILFANQADLDTYNQLTQDLVIDIKQGNELQAQAAAK